MTKAESFRWTDLSFRSSNDWLDFPGSFAGCRVIPKGQLSLQTSCSSKWHRAPANIRYRCITPQRIYVKISKNYPKCNDKFIMLSCTEKVNRTHVKKAISQDVRLNQLKRELLISVEFSANIFVRTTSSDQWSEGGEESPKQEKTLMNTKEGQKNQ